MNNNFNETVRFVPPKEEDKSIEEILLKVFEALEEKGYDPKNQIIGYILSGDPTYITSYNNARNLIRQVDRDELLEELLDFYIKENEIK
ncbi:MAG: IreB family regulatory phosphoprotein [Tissierellia bacterium]|nr:IreB family regulatory phosphoprotein [Tissierellia bacterium]